MAIQRLFELIMETRQAANWQAAFGEPQVFEGKTIIPVAQVGYGFGFGFGQGPVPAPESEEPGEAGTGEGGGGGGGASSRPLGALVITPDDVYFEQTMDEGKVALAGIALAALAILQVAKTVRAVFGQS